jgi:hypothetical protein
LQKNTSDGYANPSGSFGRWRWTFGDLYLNAKVDAVVEWVEIASYFAGFAGPPRRLREDLIATFSSSWFQVRKDQGTLQGQHLTTLSEILIAAPDILTDLTKEFVRRGDQELRKNRQSQTMACLYLARRSASLLCGLGKLLTPQTLHSFVLSAFHVHGWPPIPIDWRDFLNFFLPI